VHRPNQTGARRKKRVKSFFPSEKVVNVPNLLQVSPATVFKAHRQNLESSTSAMLAAIESVISDIEQQKSVTSNDVQDCIEKLVSIDKFGFDPSNRLFHEIDSIMQRKSLRDLSELTKKEWLALYEFGMR
jgi:4-diphosphocytidyl-2C-methyl-D-erythritol kinase